MKSSENPIIFKLGSGGKIYTFESWSEGDMWFTSAGSQAGAKVISKGTSKAKNVGKANEKTPEQQAHNEGKTIFKVNPKGSIPEKKAMYKKADKYIGKMMKVSYAEISEYGVPQHIVGEGFRLEEDM